MYSKEIFFMILFISMAFKDLEITYITYEMSRFSNLSDDSPEKRPLTCEFQ